MNQLLVPVSVPATVGSLRPIILQQWLASVGDRVAAGERVAELSIPGVLVTVSSPCEGYLERIEAMAFTPVEAGTALGWIRPEMTDEE